MNVSRSAGHPGCFVVFIFGEVTHNAFTITG
jgi:hypothetical protein